MMVPPTYKDMGVEKPKLSDVPINVMPYAHHPQYGLIVGQGGIKTLIAPIYGESPVIRTLPYLRHLQR